MGSRSVAGLHVGNGGRSGWSRIGRYRAKRRYRRVQGADGFAMVGRTAAADVLCGRLIPGWADAGIGRPLLTIVPVAVMRHFRAVRPTSGSAA